MLRIFGHYIRTGTLMLGIFECLLIIAMFYLAAPPLPAAVPMPAAVDRIMTSSILPGLGLWLLMYAFGAYEASVQRDLSLLIQRLLLACVIGGAGLFLLHGILAQDGGGMPDADAGAEAAATLFRDAAVNALVVALAFLGIVSNRAALRWGISAESFRPRLLVLGTGPRAEGLRRLHGLDTARGTALHGFLRLGTWPPGQGEAVPERLTLSCAGSLADYAVRNGINEIVVALDERRGQLPVQELLDCKLRGIRVTDIASFSEREAGKVDLDNIHPSWLIFTDGFRRSRTTAAAKRLLDIVLGLGFLLLLLPLMAVAALAVKLDSKGPVLYRQTRVGLGGRPFQILKFRSMSVDAERNGLPQWAKANDSRITRVGAVIRKTRIDEIPQVLNVLKGDMSFVGPRPERPLFVEQLSHEIEYYNERHLVKPGITGWAQVNYPYGASVEDAREKLKYDLYYMKNQSIFLDIIILLQTVRVVIWSEGAR